MDLGSLCLITGFFIFGSIALLKPDWFWEWQKASNDMRGVVSARTPAFDFSIKVVGIFSLVLGAILAFNAIYVALY